MITAQLGRITRITGAEIICTVTNNELINKVSVDDFNISYLSIGALIGTRLVDGRILIATIEDIYNKDGEIGFKSSINGIYDEVLEKYSFGTNSYPLIGEIVFKLENQILKNIFDKDKSEKTKCVIGNYFYDQNVEISYNPDILFGKHLGVFGNTGSGKTCTIVSLIQRYIRINSKKDIKFVILDVNGEYKNAFRGDEYEYHSFDSLNFNHHNLQLSEYGKLFRASEGIQYPALKECIRDLNRDKPTWNMGDLSAELNNWILKATPLDKYQSKDNFTKNQISGYLRTMIMRIDEISADEDLMKVIDNNDGESTYDSIKKSTKRVHIIDLQTSADSLDIVLYLLFKLFYINKSKREKTSHICLVLEEAHRYINNNIQETKLGTYYIDKLAREGRKYGIGLVISSQVPSMLTYEIVSQCNSTIMHKITNRRDMEYLKSVLRISSDSFFLQMSSLEKQFAVVCGEAFQNDTVVKIKDANPLPMSNDPLICDIGE